MAKLPVLSGAELISILRKNGFRIISQKGTYKTVVPLHYELSKGTLLGILKQCGLSKDDLI
ncbi:MAG: type II toxin-antitoxin system HicA family toxin [Candidatus Poribacteria bacterium]